MTTARTPGLRGRLPVKAPDDRYAIKYLHEYVTLPDPVYPIDVSGGLTEWGMLGNDQVGDCGEAGIRHIEMSTAACAKAKVPSFTTAQALSEYRAYTGGPDTGVVLADFLMWLYKKGRILAFAPVDHHAKKLVDSALQAFRGLYCGVSLTDNADELFSEHKPWAAGHPDPREGHCIAKVKATARQDVWVTWGALQASSQGWTTGCLDEVWAVITTEDSALSPAQLAQLRADIDAAGGTGGADVADPTPAPVVTVTPPAWKRVLTTLFVCIAALPVLVPTVAYLFNLSAGQAAAISSTVGGIVTVASAVHAFLVNRKVLARARSLLRRKAA